MKVSADVRCKVHKFFFYYGNVIMHSKTDEENADSLHSHLDGLAVNICYDCFSKNDGLLATTSAYKLAKNFIIEEFEKQKDPKGDMRGQSRASFTEKMSLVPYVPQMINLNAPSLITNKCLGLYRKTRFQNLHLKTVPVG